MTLQEKINSDFLAAKKNKEELTISVLTMVRAALKNKEIENKGNLKDDDVIAVVKKEVKQRKDAATQFTKGGRPELAENENKEIEILKNYLPEQMEEDAISAVVDKAIADTGASSPSDMGKVMGKVMGEIQGQADGAVVQKIVKDKLTQS